MPRWLLILLIFATTPGLAQRPARRVLPEIRGDVVTGELVSAQVAAGVHITSGTYFRVAILAGFGRAWAEDSSSASYRAELQGRFHLDPMRTTRFGLYGIGGIVTSHDAFADWQSRLVFGAGVELPAHARSTLALEAALAGGLRLSLSARRIPLGRR